MVTMGFEIVSIKKTPGPAARRIVKEKDVREGTLHYTNEGGQEAKFKYSETNDGFKHDFELEVNTRELSLIGCKYCWCINRLDVVSKGDLIKYQPELSFINHPYNCYKFKPGNKVFAEIINDIAYVISKQKRKYNKEESN